ncbi:hypothetical protein Tco_0345245 [Tanacetum coccineum]
MIKDPSKDHYQRARQALRIPLIKRGRSLIRSLEELLLHKVTVRTFIGSLWESITNVGAILLEVGLAKLQTRFGADRIADAHLLQCQNLANKHFICEGCRSVYHVKCGARFTRHEYVIDGGQGNGIVWKKK